MDEKKPELKTKLASVAFIALMLGSIFAGVVSAEQVSENLNDNTTLNETERYDENFDSVIRNCSNSVSYDSVNTVAVETATIEPSQKYHQEVGDAIYRPLDHCITKIFNEHAGIYYNLNSASRRGYVSPNTS